MEWIVVEEYRGFLLAALPPGAFIGLGLLIAAKQGLEARPTVPTRSTAVQTPATAP